MTERSDEIDDGGPAFPTKGLAFEIPGMSLRDWFAGQALIGIITTYESYNAFTDSRMAYRYADAMLKLRDK